ncbi:ClpXP protease specificity-enhancing factor SspB [Acetobacter persici]|nr:ClpXP protease specificity-enhancing factor SspB [Acetobacter persici]
MTTSLPFPKWAREQLLSIVRKAVAQMQSSHHKHLIFITFKSDYPGVLIPQSLREKAYGSWRLNSIFLYVGKQKSVTIDPDLDALTAEIKVQADFVETKIIIPFKAMTEFTDRRQNIKVELGYPAIEGTERDFFTGGLPTTITIPFYKMVMSLPHDREDISPRNIVQFNNSSI